MEYEIKRINAWSVIKIVFLVSFFIGTLVGIFYALILATISNLIRNFAVDEFGFGLGALDTISLFFVIIFFAIFVSISNSALSAIFIGVYNVMSRWIGGIKLELNLLTDLED